MKTFSGNNGERLYLETAKFYSESQRDGVTVLKTETEGLENLVARHKARYGLVALFCRPWLKVLDFPCGSGYASKLLGEYGVFYEGRDYDSVTIEYANSIYRRSIFYKDRFGNLPRFILDDLRWSNLPDEAYDVIAFIEGIEHIEQKYQAGAIKALEKALKPGGVLIVSSPEAPGGKSGPSKMNKHHLWELTKYDFVPWLTYISNFNKIELITQIDKLHTGETTNCFYAVCRK
ncbi:MAG: class I SAM-dependent methyltransferase [Desulfobacteraceae bacterium]|nr:MAG: class I SAM-dependent methyltransferase [Desulfobacteraceae bacterium]